MRFDARVHHRRSIRLKGWDYTSPAAYFVTIVAFERRNVFGEVDDERMNLNNNGRIAAREWVKLHRCFHRIAVPAFVVMPNHVHAIIEITRSPQIEQEARHTLQSTNVVPGSLGAIVRSYKSAVAAFINLINATRGAPIWQRNYHEHIIRTQDEYETIWDYIGNNLARWNDDQLSPNKQQVR